MKFTVVIPARYASTRLPAKPLRDIAGKTMIQRVYEQAQLSAASRVIVATDDQRIGTAVVGFGGEVVMTSPDHVSGTDRLEEVARQCGLGEDEIVVNVQGDEPLIPPQVIDQVAANLAANSHAGVATLSEPITDAQVFVNPNAVKVVSGHDGTALYFSRAPIPWPRDHFADSQATLPDGAAGAGVNSFQRHIGIYAYRVALLHRFVSWPVAPLEALESLEQLRFMWQGIKVHVAPALVDVPGGVDTEEDLEAVIRHLQRAGG
ncbi:MAG: 3-deoxy-manno-octulosonate cytidylyltransferase [Gammaproteobacteria bacterium]|nr:3-deoxy-manno-octulosonate cytidylyltransferase [Gammaproteobacteria bacterium]MBQ0840145.1 3-deoxy-manno-octulosonate cytidylyltransferase [Gammaproteobacteria bacterium]